MKNTLKERFEELWHEHDGKNMYMDEFLEFIEQEIEGKLEEVENKLLNQKVCIFLGIQQEFIRLTLAKLK